MPRSLCPVPFACVFVLLLALPATAAPEAPKPQARFIPIAPMHGDVEVLHGDPEAAGQPFVMRIRELPGGLIPPHRHPIDEHLTVVQGTLYFAVGADCDRGTMRELKTGSYAFVPAGTTMCGHTPEPAIVQVHGVGPFHIHWRAKGSWREGLRTLDSPDAASVFRFRKGDRVSTPRGLGRIRQGYDSGEVVAYEIDGDDGTLFMAAQADVRKAAKR